MGGAGVARGKGGWRRAVGRGAGEPGEPQEPGLRTPEGRRNPRSWLWLGAGRETWGTRLPLGEQGRGGRISTADSAQTGRPGSAGPLCLLPRIGTTDSAPLAQGRVGWEVS